MMTRKICLALTLILFFAASTVAYASGTDMSDRTALNDQEPDSSFQLMYAKLQLEMAEIAKNQTLQKMESISKLQEEQRQLAGFVSTAEQCRTEAEDSGAGVSMPSDMDAYMKANGMSYNVSGEDRLMTSDDWDGAISALEARLNELGEEVQKTMVSIQDSMGQYNSYMQGVNTQMNGANQTLISLARGQSMYGDSEIGLALTGLVVGLALGCIITLAAQKGIGKKG